MLFPAREPRSPRPPFHTRTPVDVLSDAVVLAEARAGGEHVHGGRCRSARGHAVCDAPENGSGPEGLEGSFRLRYLRSSMSFTCLKYMGCKFI